MTVLDRPVEVKKPTNEHDLIHWALLNETKALCGYPCRKRYFGSHNVQLTCVVCADLLTEQRRLTS